MFWNPATMTQHAEQGLLSESNIGFILPYSRATDGGPAPGVEVPGLDDSGDIGELGIVPASYWLYGFNDQFVAGVSLNAPFGLTTNADDWFGSPQGDKSAVKTYTLTPSAAYKLSDEFSIGVGLQAQFMTVDLTSRTPTGVKFLDVEGDDIGLGFTAGVLFEPSDATSIGIGFRSSVAHNLKGDATIAAFDGDIEAGFKSPETLTFGIRHQFNEKVTILAGAEWANWSRFDELRIEDQASGATVGLTVEDWKDSWFVSVGGEYAFDDKLTLRAGVAYEESPVGKLTRTPRVPDNDRIWLSAGASYAFNEKTTIALAYSHVFMKDGDINLAAGGGLPSLSASFNQDIDIFSLSLTRDW